jgi:hypothetical protein
VVETEDGEPAHRYVTPQGEPLSPETVIGNRSHLRKEMAARLRAFGGATRLSAAPISDLLDALAA